MYFFKILVCYKPEQISCSPGINHYLTLIHLSKGKKVSSKKGDLQQW